MCDACREKGRTYAAKKRNRGMGEMMFQFRAWDDAGAGGVDHRGGVILNMRAGARCAEREREEERVGKKIKIDVVDAKKRGTQVSVKATKSKVRRFVDILSTSSYTTNDIPSLLIYQKRPISEPPIEYQTPTLLFSALSVLLKTHPNPNPKPQSFTGTYSILSTANPSISFRKRIELVSYELMKMLGEELSIFRFFVVLWWCFVSCICVDHFLCLPSPRSSSKFLVYKIV
jgi:hypothetical protein